ncbi:MAG: extracellular solute-binding protein [Pseudomonadota bacterium]
MARDYRPLGRGVRAEVIDAGKGLVQWAGLAAGTVAALLAWSTAKADDTVTIAHGYSNFGELKYPADFPHFSYVNPDAPKGGQISQFSLGNFDSFNGYARAGVPASGTQLMYEDLMVGAADDPYGLYCNLCTTIEYPEDLKWVIVNLREDVTFSDGSPMTADDLLFTIDLFLEQGISEFRTVVGGYFDGFEKLDDYRVRFEFNDSTPLRDRIGLVGLWNPFSKAWFEETGARLDESASEPFLGTGPYVLKEVDFGRQVIYERNRNWWGADLPINQGRFNFDEVRIEYFGDSSAAFEAFKAGEYTFRTENTSRIWATAYEFPALENGWVKRETLPDGNITTAQGFIFNLRREKWQDPRVRDAVRMLFNFEWTNETLFFGLYQRPASFWGGSDLAADGAPSAEEAEILQPLVDAGLLSETVLTDPAIIPPVNDAAQNLPQRSVLRRAARLLDEAGWVPGDDGLLRNAAGETLTLEIIQFSPSFDRIINPYVENLRQIGIDAKLDRIDNAQYVERRRGGDWDLTNHSPGQGFEPGTGLKQWFSSETAENSSRNLMALQDPAVDQLVDLVIAATSLDELRPRVRALDRVLRAHGFWVSQWSNQEHWVAYWDMYRYPDELPPLALGTLDFWWYDEDAAEALRAAGALN